MKRIYLLCLLAGFGICSKAQTLKLFTTDSTAVKPQQLLLPNNIITKTPKGIVYALPQDKMPCFVPNPPAYAAMPNAYTGNYNPKAIPNPYNKRQLPDSLLQLLKPVGLQKGND